MFEQGRDGALNKTCKTCLGSIKKYRERKIREDPKGFRENKSTSSREARLKRKQEDPEGLRRRDRDQNKTRRERQIATNPDEYYAQARAHGKKHYAANRETILAKEREKYKLTISKRFNNVKIAAKSREYEWALDDDVAIEKMSNPCFYCGVLAVDWVHGLDRLDNFRGYTPDNTVGCCAQCNKMKLCIDAHTFLQRCVHISGLEKHPVAWPDTKPGNLSRYRANAKTKKRAFELTKEAYDELANLPCVYCHRDITETNTSGIDRIDNDLGYVPGNMQPCCSECNVMRGALTVEAFLEKVSRIAARAELLLVPEMPTFLTALPRRKRKDPGTTAPTTKKQKKKTLTRTGDAP